MGNVIIRYCPATFTALVKFIELPALMCKSQDASIQYPILNKYLNGEACSTCVRIISVGCLIIKDFLVH